MRRVLGAHGRTLRVLVSRACLASAGRDARDRGRPGARRRAVRAATRVRRPRRRAMRHLHAGHADRLGGTAGPLPRSRARRGRSARGARRQSVPLYRVSEDRRRRPRGSTRATPREREAQRTLAAWPVREAGPRMRSPVTQYAVVRRRRLEEALRALSKANGAGRIVPLAGGTDVFVALNAGAPPGTRYLDLLALDELRGIRVMAAGVTLGAL